MLNDIHINHLFNENPYSEMDRFREKYIYENKEPQLDKLDKWLTEFIKFWNFAYEDTYKPSWNERILLSIYICEYFKTKASYRLSFKYADNKTTVADKLLDLLDNYPNTDALSDEIFEEDLREKVLDLIKFIN